jgi:hypothetical protein
LWVGDWVAGISSIFAGVDNEGVGEGLTRREMSGPTSLKSNKTLDSVALGSEEDMPIMPATTETVATRITIPQIPAVNAILCFREAMMDNSSSLYFQEHPTSSSLSS